MIGEQSWNAGPTRTWIVGILDQNAYNPVTLTGQSWIYNSKNIAYPMHTAFRASEGLPYSGYPNNDSSIGSRHPGGAHMAMVDGSARFFREEVDLNNVLKAMATRANDEVTTDAN
jgi:prepilin-type processing-associated H-X9-DG protein